MTDRGARDTELVVSWDDTASIEVEYLPAPPVVVGLAVRPEHLTDRGRSIYYDDNLEWYEHMHRRLTRLAATALRVHSAVRVVTNLALGWDTALAEAADGLRLPFTVALPYQGVQSKWHSYHKQRFARLMGKAAETHTLFKGGYEVWKLAKARGHLVQASDLILTLWDSPDHADAALLTLARNDHKTVVNLWDSWVRYGGLISRSG